MDRIAIDGAHMYWTTDDVIRRVGKDGGGLTALVTGLATPSGIAVDSRAHLLRHEYRLNDTLGGARRQ